MPRHEVPEYKVIPLPRAPADLVRLLNEFTAGDWIFDSVLPNSEHVGSGRDVQVAGIFYRLRQVDRPGPQPGDKIEPEVHSEPQLTEVAKLVKKWWQDPVEMRRQLALKLGILSPEPVGTGFSGKVD